MADHPLLGIYVNWITSSETELITQCHCVGEARR